VSHGRYVTFQMAEVAIPRQMSQEILRLIAELRPGTTRCARGSPFDASAFGFVQRRISFWRPMGCASACDSRRPLADCLWTFNLSLARPGGNTTGFAMFEVSMGGKWLDLLKKLTPSTERVAILSNPVTSTAPFGKLYFQSINAAAPRFGIKPFSLEVDNKADLEQRLSELAREPNSGLIVLLDAFTYVHRDIIIDQAARHRIPAIYTVSFFAEAGGLASYGVDLAAQFGQAATYVDRIFKGTKPADLPVQQPTKFKLVINLKAAKGLGITIPQSLLVTADEVME
jgi:putative tryptophan/tyrosine transport system substrate-binding protein